MAIPIEGRPALIFPDSSRPMDWYVVKEQGKRSLKTIEPLIHLGLEDYRITKHSPQGTNPQVSYELELVLGGSKWFTFLLRSSEFYRKITDLARSTKLILTEDSVSLQHADRELFGIVKGTSSEMINRKGSKNHISTGNERENVFLFGVDLELTKPALETVPVGISMVYDLSILKKAYLSGMPFSSNEFYDTVRPGLKAVIG